MQEEQWDIYLQQLIDGTRTAIEKFALEHPNEEVCYFAYDSEPCYGYVLTCFNTTEANRLYVPLRHEELVSRRKGQTEKWGRRKQDYYFLRTSSVLPFCNNTGEFRYQDFAELKFPEWQQFAESESYPEFEDNDRDYLLNHVAWLFGKALDTLAEDGSFEKLKLASPTLLGFAFHDEEQYVVRLLRFPTD